MQGGYYQSYQNGFLGSPASVIAAGGIGNIYTPTAMPIVGNVGITGANGGGMGGGSLSPNIGFHNPHHHMQQQQHQISHQRSNSSPNNLSPAVILVQQQQQTPQPPSQPTHKTPPYQQKNPLHGRIHHHQRNNSADTTAAAAVTADTQINLGTYDDLTWEEIYMIYHHFNMVDADGKGVISSFTQLIQYISSLFPTSTPPTSQFLFSIGLLYPGSVPNLQHQSMSPLNIQQLIFSYSHCKPMINLNSSSSTTGCRKFTPQQALYMIDVFNSVKDKTGGVPTQKLALFGADRSKLPSTTLPFHEFVQYIGLNYIPFENLYKLQQSPTFEPQTFVQEVDDFEHADLFFDNKPNNNNNNNFNNYNQAPPQQQQQQQQPPSQPQQPPQQQPQPQPQQQNNQNNFNNYNNFNNQNNQNNFNQNNFNNQNISNFNNNQNNFNNNNNNNNFNNNQNNFNNFNFNNYQQQQSPQNNFNNYNQNNFNNNQNNNNNQNFNNFNQNNFNNNQNNNGGNILKTSGNNTILNPNIQQQSAFSDIEIQFSELNIQTKLGEGTFGVVYKGTWRGSTVAIKQIKINEDVTNQVLDEFRKELTILSKLRHPNIVLLMAACTQPPNLCFVTEFLNGGSLYDILHSKKIRMNMPLYKKLAIQIAQGMNYLHLSNVIHRDIKSLNLLLDDNMNVKICDFGLSRLKTKSTAMTKSIGSPIWMAPELLIGDDYTEKVDVYAFGIILWELGTGELPYSGLDSVQLALAVSSKGLRPTIPSSWPAQLQQLIQSCWNHEPALRPSFSQILQKLENMPV